MSWRKPMWVVRLKRCSRTMRIDEGWFRLLSDSIQNLYLKPLSIVYSKPKTPYWNESMCSNPIWHSLSVVLRGHPGGKNRKPSEGLLPAGMHAKSLRRWEIPKLSSAGTTHGFWGVKSILIFKNKICDFV